MKESSKHRRAFALYVRLGGGRSLEALQEGIAENPGEIGLQRAPTLRTVEAWSAELHWQDRLLDLEREAADRTRDELVSELAQMNERHAREGLALQQKGVQRLQDVPLSEMNAGDAIRAVTEGVRLERLARGAPTERLSQEGVVLHGSIDLSAFSNEELRRLVELGERRATGAG